MEGKVAAVTGGTKGIGADVVGRLLTDGYAVVAASRSATPERGDGLTVAQADRGAAEGVATLAAAAEGVVADRMAAQLGATSKTV